ncbi:unnamed protein product [Rhizoctonia solani]|uniref:Uncharacterized protein n=1 Tax=Rhizoctonia solani TaxID=456999 RepID=A0A8H3ADX5_9AGAM|nr:unnamed protein product [Rhizoctonia solani]
MNLPPELIPLLGTDCRISAALALVNKHYNEAITPILYKNIFLYRLGVFKKLSNTLTTGHSRLRRYPRYLFISYWYDSWELIGHEPVMHIKQILMHAPNLSTLNLRIKEPVARYLIETPQYPFKLRQLVMRPVQDATFVEFLKTQSEIEYVRLWASDNEKDWHTGPSPLQPDILPKLRSVQSNETNVSFLLPYHPVTRVQVFGLLRDPEVHKQIAKSLAPLESLSECIALSEHPWESGIISQWLPSLEFCRSSLSEYSLDMYTVNPEIDSPSIILFFKERGSGPPYGLYTLRNGLSAFTTLRKFSLDLPSYNQSTLTPEFCRTVPELSRLEVWQESCPSLEEVKLFGVILK